MGLEREYGIEWRDETKLVRYPFTDTSTLTTTDNLLFDQSSVYDASFYVIGWNKRLFITSIEIYSDPNKIVKINIGDVSTPSIAFATLDPFNIPEIIRFEDNDARQAGLMVVDPVAMSFIQTWSPGEHNFRSNAEFVPSVVLPMPTKTVTALKDSSGNLVSGDVWLVGEEGVVLRLESGKIRVDIVGDPLFKRREYENTDEFPTPRFVKTINGVPPDDFGDFKIVVGDFIVNDTILRVYPDPSLPGIRIDLVGQTLQAIV